MQIILGEYRRFFAIFSAVAFAFAGFAAQPALAQQGPPPSLQPEDPWLYRGTDIPPDRNWQFGELDNGLRYAVRRNGVPPGQVSIRIRIDAGSLHERDDERGFAHLIEHLTFRESKYLGPGESISRWQRLGATFGSDTNAETTPTHTVYKLDLPDVNDAKLDETFRLLSGMIREPALSSANLAADVPIVLAERRDGAGVARRVGDATRSLYFEGQRLVERSPIGTDESLQGATQEAVRAFHKRWYRPDNTAIIAVGDIDPVQLAWLVETYFGDWKAEGAIEPDPDFGAPVAPPGGQGDAPVGTVKVLVEPDLPRSLTIAILRPWQEVTDNLEYNRGLLIDALAQSIINRRMESRARSGGHFLVAGVQQEDISRSTDATFISVTPLDEDWRKSLREVREVIADALAHPPSEEEIERELAEFDVVFANLVEQETIQASRDLADNLVQALDIRETVASPATVLAVFRAMRARFTPEAVFEHTNKLFDGTVTRAIYITPATGEADAEALRAVLTEPVEANGRAEAAAAIKFDDLPPIGEPAAPLSNTRLGLLDIDRLEFANGVRAQVWRTTNEPGRATVQVRFGHGFQDIAEEDAPYVPLGQMALVSSGLGTLGEEELDRLATGRKFGFEFQIQDGAFVLRGETRAADVADQLYLFAAKLAMPRWDDAPFQRARAAGRIAYDSYGTNPSGVLERDLDWLLAGQDPRFAKPDPATLEEVTVERFREVWEPILSHGPVEVMVYGDIDYAETIAALSRTFGALPPRKNVAAAELHPVPEFPAPRSEPLVRAHRGDPNQAAAVVAWPTGGGVEGMGEGRQLEVLGQVFANRLLEAIRERDGSSYAPHVSASWPDDVATGGNLMALAQLPPGQLRGFFTEVDRIAADLAASGPTADELQRVTEPLRNLIDRALTGHGFWMSQLEGASFEPRKVSALRGLMRDYTEVTPEQIQQLAQKYLRAEEAWRLSVVPDSHTGGR